jgi:hypothetical protein
MGISVWKNKDDPDLLASWEMTEKNNMKDTVDLPTHIFVNFHFFSF